VWSQAYDTLEEAQSEAAGLELNAKAVVMGLTLEEFKDRQNANRIPVKKAIESSLSHATKTKEQKTLAGYKLNLQQFEESIGPKVRFLDEVGKTELCGFRDFLAGKGYEARTQHNRMMTVQSQQVTLTRVLESSH
jgi:hypothetical protein